MTTNDNFQLTELSPAELTILNGGGIMDEVWSWVGKKIARIGLAMVPSKEHVENGGYWDYYNPNDPLM